MPKVKKLPKWAIRQAGGINKKAWALARRGRTSGQRTRNGPRVKRQKTRRTPRAVGGASHGSNNSKPGWGRIFKMGRTIDVFSGPAQGAVSNDGFTPDAGKHAIERYTGLDPDTGAFDIDQVKPTAGSIGTGLVRNWLRSKLGIYRGVGQKKILSVVMAANPEILASTQVNPAENVRRWNARRSEFDRGYNPNAHAWDLNPGTFTGEQFFKSIGFDAALAVTQKAAERFLNPMLPPGFNL